MPSAVTKPDNKTSPEVSNTISSAIDAVEKKCRNLVKKKGRLEQYREKAASGGVLNADQLKAVGGYDGIVANIEFASELTKLFASMQVEAEKLSVKQLKREAYERQQSELKRLRTVLDLQNLLDSLGPDEVRADLKAGAHGLPVLTEDNITQLDEFYTLINPTRDGETSYPEQLSAAAEHVTAYLEARDKAVVGTTYKAIREMADKISESGYLDRTPEEPTEEEEVVLEETEDEVVDEQVLVQEEEPCEQQLEPEVLVVEAAVPEYAPAVAELPEAVPESVPADYGVQMVAAVEQEAADTEGETFLDTQAPAGRQAPRPFNEIVSSVQGNFNFLQDSEIESNPAAVAPVEAVHLESAPAAAVTHYGVPETQAFQEAAVAPQYVAPKVADAHAPYEPAAVEPAYSEQPVYSAQSLMPGHMQSGAPQYDGTLTQESAQAYDQLSDESKKEYTMNPNAEIFNSVYTQAPGNDAVTAEPTYQQAATTQHAPTQPPANAWANTPDFSHTAQSTYGYGAAAAPPRRGGSAGPQGGSSQQGGGQRSNYRGGQQGGQRQGGQNNGYRGGQSGGGQRNGGGQGYGGQRGQQGMSSGQRGGGGGYRGRDYQDQSYQGSQGSYNQGYQGGNRGGRGGNGGRGGGRGGYGGGGRMGGGSNQ